MSQRRPKSNRHTADHARPVVGEAVPLPSLGAFAPSPARAAAAEARLSADPAAALEAAATSAERESSPAEVPPLEVARILQALRDEVRALGQRLDGWQDGAMTRPATPEALSAPTPEKALRGPSAADEPPAASGPESAASPVPSGIAKGVERPGDRSTKSLSLRCRLRELSVLASDSSRSTRVLSAHEPFETRLALDLTADSNYVAFPVLCEVSVHARRLGSGQTSIAGEASQSIASAAEGASLRCKGLPLPAGLYRFVATAAVSGPGDARPRGVAFLDGGLIRVA